MIANTGGTDAVIRMTCAGDRSTILLYIYCVSLYMIKFSHQMSLSLSDIQHFYVVEHNKLVQSGRLTTKYPLKFNNNKTRAGVCKYSPVSCIELSKVFINSPLVKPQDIRNTILHELAHAITGPHVRDPHGEEWKEAARSIGCDAQRCSPMFNTDSAYIVRCEGGCMARRHRKPTKFTKRVHRCKAHSKPLIVYRKCSKDRKYHKLI